MVAEGDLGPASDLLALIREAGIQVRAEDEDNGTRLVLPSGGQLVLADGQTSVEYRDVVYFDLSPDYRGATRIALSHSQDTSARTVAEATGLFQALGKKVSVVGDVRHDRRAHGGADHRPGARRRRQGGGHRAGHRHRDAPGRQLPARSLRVEPSPRPRLGRLPPGGPARARSVRPLRAVPRALPARVRRQKREDLP
ncbi:hypothetical protein SHIRM173S_04909 [Streptomyces hirsutus]